MSIVTATIEKKGKVLNPVYELVSIDINREVNRIPYAQLLLIDGNAATRKFPLSDEDFFSPGSEIEIKLRYEGQQKSSATVFKGLVIRHGLESDAQESILRIELKDSAYLMTMVRKSAIHEGTDNSIIQKLIESAKLTADVSKEKSNQTKHPELVQYYCSDWDFMLSRVDAQNQLVAVQDGKVSVVPLEVKGKVKHTFEYGIDPIYSFEMETDASHQYEQFISTAWDQSTNEMRKAEQSTPFSLSQGQNKTEAEEAAKEFGDQKFSLISTVALDPEEIKFWANSRMARSRMSFIRGSICVPGFAEIRLLDLAEILGLGKRFIGETLITGFRHQVDADGWKTHIQFGLSAEPFAYATKIMDVPAGGLLPAVHGLQPGIVEAFEKDPDQQFRVRIKLPGVDPSKGIVWARLAMPGAGKGRGQLFLPEKGDEVIVGFFNDDPRQPVILGALYSSTNKPPEGWENWTDKNINKGFVSKTGVTIAIDDEKDGAITLSTKKNQKIRIDDNSKTIEIIDANKNQITLGDKGIVIKIGKQLSIEADGDIEIKGKNITLDASDDVEIKGTKVNIN